MKFSLIGDQPSKRHGENSCREKLDQLLRAEGTEPRIVYKFSRHALQHADVVILSPGAGKVTFVWEIFLVTLFLIRGSKVYLWFHNSSFRRWRWISRILGRRKWVKELCLQQWQVQQSSNGVHFPNYTEHVSLRAKKCKKLVFLSKLDRAKGVARALRVFKLLQAEDPAWKLDIIGPDGDWDAAESVNTNASVLPPAWGNEKFNLLATAGIFLFPSQYSSETQPLVVLEALSVGLPVVISNVNHIGETITTTSGELAGIVLDENATDEDYAQAVNAVHNQWSVLSERALCLHSDQYSEKSFISRMRSVLDLNTN